MIKIGNLYKGLLAGCLLAIIFGIVALCVDQVVNVGADSPFVCGFSDMRITNSSPSTVYSFVSRIQPVEERIKTSRLFFGGQRSIAYSDLPSDFNGENASGNMVILIVSLVLVFGAAIYSLMKLRSNGGFAGFLLGGILTVATIGHLVVVIRSTKACSGMSGTKSSLGVSAYMVIMGIVVLGILSIFCFLSKNKPAEDSKKPAGLSNEEEPLSNHHSISKPNTADAAAAYEHQVFQQDYNMSSMNNNNYGQYPVANGNQGMTQTGMNGPPGLY